jgi:ABC-type sugar transport system ATPase subunit
VFQVVDRIVVMRRGKIVADDIDPKATSVAEVENVITGDLTGPTHCDDDRGPSASPTANYAIRFFRNKYFRKIEGCAIVLLS